MCELNVRVRLEEEREEKIRDRSEGEDVSKT
jgi:hypothetical protein